MPKEEPPALTNDFHHEPQSRINSLWRQVLCLLSDGRRKKNGTWYHYDDSLYRIIQEIFINLISVKFIDSSPLR